MDVLQLLRDHLLQHQSSSIPDVEIFSKLLTDIQDKLTAILQDHNNELHLDQHIVRCIDLEGLDGCGKSTLTTELQKQLNARGQQSRVLISPPNQLLPFRPYFDAQPESIRRAFYNLGNLIVSFDLQNQPETITVLDRYWPSTIAYQLARTTEDTQLNLSWPKHLVQPALIIYIHVDEAERCRRITQRSKSIPVTLEEQELAAQEAFRRRLDSIYRNHIPSSHLYVVDGNKSTVDIATDILALLPN